MEAKTKIMAAVAVIVMCAAGLVGAGYAYTATTTNDGNDVSSEYVVLSQSGLGKYTFADNQKVYYNTANTKTGTTYALDNPTTMSISEVEHKVVKIGNDFTVSATQPIAATADLTCAVTITGATITEGYKLFLKIVSADTTTTDWLVYTEGAWVGNDNEFDFKLNSTTYHNATVSVYYGYPSANVPTTQPNATPLSSSVLTFTVQNGLHNATFYIAGVSNATPTAGTLLNTITFTVKKISDDSALAVNTDYTVVWKVGGSSAQGTDPVVAGTVYTAIITGAGTYAGMTAECVITGIAAS